MQGIYPSFKAQYGRAPEPGRDYDPDKCMCQDDYEYFSGEGAYSDTPPAELRLCPFCGEPLTDPCDENFCENCFQNYPW